jgi:hypothetical protein
MPEMPRIPQRKVCGRVLVCLLAMVFAGWFWPLPAGAATAGEVDRALAKAKGYIYYRLKDGNCEVSEKRDAGGPKYSVKAGQWGGSTAVAVYALLASGEDPQDPKLAPAIKWLKTADMIGTYAISMRCQVWLMLQRTAETKKLAAADMERLEGGFNSTGRGKFLYNYLTTKRDINLVDHSVSQYGVLSMWACAQMGVEIPTEYWNHVELRWLYDQKPDGGWLYADKPNATDHSSEQASMTAAGVATLFITQDYVHAEDGIRCRGNLKSEAIDKGLKWMADHTSDWTPSLYFDGFSLPGYTLYGVERIGVASGLKYFGDVDWYQFGADWCVKNQAGDGSWGRNIPNTALCMLFLARGRAPVLINKIQYDVASGANAGKPGNWNERPRDVANFVRWMGEQTERDINWQITNLDVPEDELHDAPFLYFSGNEAISLKPEQVDKLRAYVNNGGMILFNADCGTAEIPKNKFVTSISALGKQMFPDYEFRDLPASHPIFTSEQYPPGRWKRKVVLRGLSNGVRELMVIMPNDPARSWQLRESSGTGHEEAYQSTDDLILYGTDKQNLLVKGESRLVTVDAKVTATKTAKVIRLKYDRNWNPEPGGWDRLAAAMHNLARVDLTTETAALSDQPIGECTIAHLTGTTPVNFSVAQQQQLKNFVVGGGTLVVDCAGGSSEFAPSAETLLKKLFPSAELSVLPPKDALYSAGVPKGAIRYRQFAKSVLGNVRSPQIKTIRLNNRNAVYYSRYDLSGGLVGENVDGIVGYDPSSCTQIMSGIILQTLKQK